jgi:hypothetical protein
VAKSTHAGIPWLRFIRQRLSSRVHFWPFDGWDFPAGAISHRRRLSCLWSRGFARENQSIPPEKLLHSSLLQAFYTIRSERQRMERLDFDLLFRWFVGLGNDDEVWDHSVYSKNRDRLLEAEIAAKFLAAILTQPEVKRLLSSDHFSVDERPSVACTGAKVVAPRAAGRPVLTTPAHAATYLCLARHVVAVPN